jgi:putative FmdB family regulatory protein
MRYDYKCPVCGYVEEEYHSMKEEPVFLCPKCKSTGSEIRRERQFSLGAGFIIRGGTEATHWKNKRDHLAKRDRLGTRQIDRWGTGPKLQPNVAGIETDNWEDASKLAKEAGINEESYEPMIEKEKHVSKVSGVDDRAWKKAKEETL